MKLYHLSRVGVVCLLLKIFLTGCGEDDTVTHTIPTPDTYIFERNGFSSVSFSGQTTRIAMAEEIISTLKDNTSSKTAIDAMFAHEEGDNVFSDASLNASGKNVRSKTAASQDFFSANTTAAAQIKQDFDEYIHNQVTQVFPNWTVVALAGTAGMIREADGGPNRYVTRNGLELNQVFNKSLIGACMVDQMLNNYLGTAVLDAGTNTEENDAKTVATDKNYTTMEHKWDEAFGYLYGALVNTSNPNATIGSDDNFLNRSVGRVGNDNDFVSITADILNAFKLGRAAIVAKNYTVRDAQAAIIREKISQAIAIQVIHYLQRGKNDLSVTTPDMASVFHDLSKGYGFIYSLQFTRKPGTNESYFTRTETRAFLDKLMSADDISANGLWNVTTTVLDEISNDIATKFDFTVEQAGS